MKKVDLNNIIFFLLGFYDDPKDLEKLGGHCFDRAEEMRERLAEEYDQEVYEAAAFDADLRLRDMCDRLHDLRRGNPVEVHK